MNIDIEKAPAALHITIHFDTLNRIALQCHDPLLMLLYVLDTLSHLLCAITTILSSAA